MATNWSYWEQETFFNYDVIVIGSGIVGLTAAVALKNLKPKISIAILESGFLPTGASTKNAGFACFGSVSELIEQEKVCGAAELNNLIAKRWNGLLTLRKLLGNAAIDYQNNGGYELFKTEDKLLYQECQSKITYFNHLIKNVVNHQATFKINNQKINTFGFKGVNAIIKNSLEAQIDTGKMMQALLNKAAAVGINIFNNCKVIKIETNTNNPVLITNNGNFKAKKIIIATNAFAKTLVPNLEIVAGRGQVLITKPIANLKLKGTFHYQKGFYYFRNIANRILIGGGRNLAFKTEETTKFGTTTLVQNALKKLLSDVILPNTPFKIDYNWSGIMAFGSSLTPIVKQIQPHVFCAVRCNGMGIAIGSQTGQEIAEMVANEL